MLHPALEIQTEDED